MVALKSLCPHPNAQDPVNVASFGETVFADMTKLRILTGGCAELSGRTPNLTTSVLIADIQGGGHVKAEGDRAVRWPPEAGRDKKDPPLEPPKGAQPC